MKKVKERLKFIGYNGEYPNLCSGILIMELDGKEITFPYSCLQSGGSIWFDEEGFEHIEKGEWSISQFPKNFSKELKNYAKELVNKNIEYGCCGGCV